MVFIKQDWQNYEKAIESTASNPNGMSDLLWHPKFNFTWLIQNKAEESTDNGEEEQEVWKGVYWELSQIIIGILSLIISLGALPCCFFLAKNKLEAWKGRREGRTRRTRQTGIEMTERGNTAETEEAVRNLIQDVQEQVRKNRGNR